MQQNNSLNSISLASIFLGALVAIAFLATLSSLGLAAYQTLPFGRDMNVSKTGGVAIGLLVIVVLVLAFALGGWLASFASRPDLRTSIIHSLGSWALLAVFISVLSMAATASLGIDLSIKKLSFPVIVTDIRVLDAKAVTRLSLEPAQENLPEKKAADQASILISWIAFLSIALGLGASIGGGIFSCKHKVIRHRI